MREKLSKISSEGGRWPLSQPWWQQDGNKNRASDFPLGKGGKLPQTVNITKRFLTEKSPTVRDGTQRQKAVEENWLYLDRRHDSRLDLCRGGSGSPAKTHSNELTCTQLKIMPESKGMSEKGASPRSCRVGSVGALTDLILPLEQPRAKP